MTPTISVIIPAFNSARFIADAVESALNQSIGGSQIIVVDDGSTDDTADRLGQFSDRIIVIRQPNRGVAAARNAGMARANGDWLALLDADDVWHPRKLEYQLNAVARRGDIGLLGTGTFDYPENPLPSVLPTTDLRPLSLENLLIRNQLTTSSVIVRTSVARRVGDFDTSLQGPEDYDYWLRAAEISGIAILPSPLTGYRNVAGSLSRQAMTMETGLRRILRKCDQRGVWQNRGGLRRKAISYRHCSCAYLHAKAGGYLTAIRRTIQSLLWYPLPFERSEARVRFARPKQLTVLVLRMLGLMAPEPGGRR